MACQLLLLSLQRVQDYYCTSSLLVAYAPRSIGCSHSDALTCLCVTLN
jgi:hypothetical protein